MRLIICGAGQYGQVAREIAEEMKVFSQIDFLDDRNEAAVGKLSDIEKVEYEKAFVAIGNPEVRHKLLGKIPEGKRATLIHSRAVVMESATIGAGSIIEAGAVICTNAVVGSGCIVMANAVVGHDARVGAYCQLKYHASVPERCEVPEGMKLECNAVYRDRAKPEEVNRRFSNASEREYTALGCFPQSFTND